MKLFISRAPVTDRNNLQVILGKEWEVIGYGEDAVNAFFTDIVIEGPLRDKFERDWYDVIKKLSRKEPLLLRIK